MIVAFDGWAGSPTRCFHCWTTNLRPGERTICFGIHDEALLGYVDNAAVIAPDGQPTYGTLSLCPSCADQVAVANGGLGKADADSLRQAHLEQTDALNARIAELETEQERLVSQSDLLVRRVADRLAETAVAKT